MEPTDFEKWCAKELHVPVSMVTSFRREHQDGHWTYALAGIEYKYRAYMAGVRGILPYQTQTQTQTPPQPPEE